MRVTDKFGVAIDLEHVKGNRYHVGQEVASKMWVCYDQIQNKVVAQLNSRPSALRVMRGREETDLLS